jgi:hypothetical protein
MKNITALFLCCFMLASVQSAWSTTAGTSGAEFLRIGVSARPSSMGETSAALGGASAIFYNPAGLSVIENTEFTAAQVNWIENISYSNLAVGKTFSFGSLAFGANYLSVPPIQMVNNTGTKLNENYSVNDVALSLGYAKALAPGLRAGVAASHITSTIADYSASAMAASAGLQFDISKQLTLAVAAQNLGSNIKFNKEGDPLPTNYKAGAAYTIYFDPSEDTTETSLIGDRSLLIAGDANMSREVGFYGNGGLEYCMSFNDIMKLSLRGGYRSDLNDKVNGFSLGLGADISSFTVDYAYSGLGDLGMAHRLTVSYRIASTAQRKKHSAKKNNYLK